MISRHPNHRSSKHPSILRISAVVLALSLSLVAACERVRSIGTDNNGLEDEPLIPVETARIERGDIVAVYSSTAPIEALAEAEVVAKVAGEVRQLLVEEGDKVDKDQILAKLDGDRLRFELMQIEANLRKTQRDYRRNLDLKDRGLISAGDFEKLKYDMESLEAEYNLARLELGYTDIRAPFDGVVTERFVKVGNTINVGTPTFHITKLEPLVAYLHVPEREYRHMQPEQFARIRVDALQGRTFKGVIARISPVVDSDTGTFKVTVEVTDDTGELRPGMFGRVGIVYDTHIQALQVPRSAVINDTGKTYIFVVENGIADRRFVEIGLSDGGNIEIVSGLTGDEEIIIVGQTSLKDGAKVTIINSLDGEESAKNIDVAAE